MVPRTEIEAVEFNSSIENLKSHFVESGNSKIIVYKEDIDHVVGHPLLRDVPQSGRLDTAHQGDAYRSGNHAGPETAEKIQCSKRNQWPSW